MAVAKKAAPAKAARVKASLEPLRRRIDEINLKLVDLLSERAAIAQEIGHLKEADGAPVHQPAREREVFAQIAAHNPGPLSGEHLRRIFTEIMSACLALERTIRVAYLGPEHTYSHEAARERFGASATYGTEPSMAAVFHALENERADYAVAPVENTTEGAVPLTLDLLIDTPTVIIGEILLPIRHALMSGEGDPARIRRILSHQQSLAQCREYLTANYPHCELEAVSSNTAAAQRAVSEPDAAAICSAAAAEPYGLKIIAENIQDVAQNTTRFLVLGRAPANRSGADKTSLLFALAERAGSLHHALSLFAREKINLTMIQSRPQRERPWADLVYVDLEGHREDARVRRALKALEREALFLKVLGSYPDGRSAGA